MGEAPSLEQEALMYDWDETDEEQWELEMLHKYGEDFDPAEMVEEPSEDVLLLPYRVRM